MKDENNLVHLSFSTFEFERFLMRLVVAMSQSNLSYSDLAYRSNLCTSTICRIMSRRSKNMFAGTVAKLAQALALSSDYLLGTRDARTARERSIEQEAEANWHFEQRRRWKTG